MMAQQIDLTCFRAVQDWLDRDGGPCVFVAVASAPEARLELPLWFNRGSDFYDCVPSAQHHYKGRVWPPPDRVLAFVREDWVGPDGRWCWVGRCDEMGLAVKGRLRAADTYPTPVLH